MNHYQNTLTGEVVSEDDMPKTKLFIEKARAVHGDRYSYERVV